MKALWPLLILLAVVARPVSAQTNAPNLFSYIHSDSGAFALEKAQAIYRGNVRVDDPKLKLRCAWLVADLPNGTNFNRHVVALTNVVMDLASGTNQAWHVTCDQAVYDFRLVGAATNETVTISGHARAESSQIIEEGEPLVYDMVSQEFTGSDYTTTFKRGIALPGGTTAPGSKPTRAPDRPF